MRLRAFRDDDLEVYEGFISREDVARYLPFGPRRGSEARESVSGKTGEAMLGPQRDSVMSLAVAMAGDDRLIGEVVAFHRDPAEATVEVGVVFDPRHGGRGYATEAVGALVGMLFGELGMRRVTARLDDRNVASARLFERLGFRREAHLIENEHVKGELTSELDFAVLAREWREGSRRGPTEGRNPG
ncbi:GNAT family N-acetyltransferase [Thermoleophilia bacterium SCSIO 60948]|nr:GNAT family N-acetyltransferase [Thermoleophilia bacterium SCSIO 60948]